ncbi:MAG: ABC transporter ATP-binding protein, partial [Thermoplasmata archaeon]
IAFLHGGIIIEIGTPEEIKTSTNEFIKKFVESASL